jgi:uroporphyrinogen decarboxylase
LICALSGGAVQFSPSVYEHAARLIDRSPWDVSRDAGLLFEGHAAAFRRYAHRPVVVGIDIYNLEAEAYGATVERPADNDIPAIGAHPFRDLAALVELAPFDPRAGRPGMAIDVGRRLRREFPDADVRIPVSGPFSIAANLAGFETLLEGCLVDPAGARAVLARVAANQEPFVRAIADAGLDVAFFESAATPPLLSPRQFRELEVPAVRPLLDRFAATVGHPVAFVIGGNTVPILDAILGMGCGYVICPVESDQDAFMARMAGHPEVMVRVNMDHRIVAGPSWEAIRAEADRVVALARMRKQACIGTGALPYETPPENVLRLKDYVTSMPGA